MHYSKSFLKIVIVRLDFGRLPVLQTEQETPFTKDMRDRYPEVEANSSTQFSFVVAPTGVNVGQQGAGWVRVHKAQGVLRSVTLAPDFLAIEYGEGAYSHFDDLRGELDFVFSAFRRHFGTLQFTRIGLRYVNEITLAEGGPLDWEGLINANLVTAVKAGLPKDLRMARSLHQLIATRDDLSVILNYGINNPDFPNPVARRQFVLDLDCYISGIVEFVEAEERIKEVNRLAENVFESSIEDGLRKIMEIVKQ